MRAIGLQLGSGGGVVFAWFAFLVNCFGLYDYFYIFCGLREGNKGAKTKVQGARNKAQGRSERNGI